MTDDGRLFDPDLFGSTKTRKTSDKAPSDVEPWREGWVRIRSAKKHVPFWHRLAPPEGLDPGTSVTLCGIVGGAITHDVVTDGQMMVACPACAAKPASRRLYRSTDPVTSQAAGDGIDDDQATTQLTKIERIIHAAGRYGLTDEELCRELRPTGWADSGIRTRRQTLTEMSVIAERGLRMSSRGRLMRVWIHADYMGDTE